MSFLNEFQLPIRVYYEDTDAGGVVYHANYLRFMERARTEWLRELGFEQDRLANELNTVFVVAGLDINYRRPARFNDELIVITHIQKVGRASINFTQTIERVNTNQQGEQLTTSNVKVASVALDTFRTTPIPDIIRRQLQ